MLLEGLPVFGSVDDDLAGESVTEGVQGRGPFAFFGARASGKLRVTGLNNTFEPIPFVLNVRIAA